MFASSLQLSHPKIPLLTARARHAIDLTLIKVIAHRKNPSQAPLPSDPRSLERALNEVFEAIPKRKQDDAMAKFESLLNPAERTRVYGDLGQVNFASAVSVVDQVKALPLPAALRFTDADVTELNKQMIAKTVTGKALKHIGQPATAAAGYAAAARQVAPVASTLNFAVVSATCVKPNDLRKDEIDMVVGAVDGVGEAFDAGPFFVGKFKKGESIDLGAAGQLFSFKIADQVFPASFPAFAFMIESDVIQNTELAEKLTDAFIITAVSLQIIGLAILGVGMAGLISASASLTAFLVIWIVAGAFALTGHYIMPILSDDISFASGDTLVLDAPPAPGSVFERNITISNFGEFSRGTYNVLFRWSAIA
jgi:hypothetical protein